MQKKEKDKHKEVMNLLRTQKIRGMKEIESYKLSSEKKMPKRQGKNGIHIKEGNLNDILYRILGADTTTIPGL